MITDNYAERRKRVISLALYIIGIPAALAGLIATFQYGLWWATFGVVLTIPGLYTARESFTNLKNYIDTGSVLSRNDGFIFLASSIIAFTGTYLFTIK